MWIEAWDSMAPSSVNKAETWHWKTTPQRIEATLPESERAKKTAELHSFVRKNEVKSRLIGLFSKPHSPGRTTANTNSRGNNENTS